jgi:hypothetical protein
LAQLSLQAFSEVCGEIFKQKHGNIVISVGERGENCTDYRVGVGMGERMVCNALPLPLVALLATIYICHKNRNKIIYYFCKLKKKNKL